MVGGSWGLIRRQPLFSGETYLSRRRLLVQLWACTSKRGISTENVAEFSAQPKMLSQPKQMAVACTGPFWSRYNRVIAQTLPRQVTLNRSVLNSQQYAISSSASPETNEKETNQAGEGHAATVEKNNASTNGEAEETSADNKGPYKTEDAGSDSELKTPTSQYVRRRRKKGTKRTAFSDSETEDELSVDDLVKLVAEKEELMQIKTKEIEKMQDKVLRTYAEMENVMDRTKREAENSKKFAIQNFAKSLLDVADNLGRASSVVKDSFLKIDASKDTVGAMPLLKTLLEGVEMTDKQLAEVFRKFGLEKYDPVDEPFDPNRHNAVFQMPDDSKPPGTVATVLKSGYMLHERVIRPAEVGVTQASENNKNEEE
ncbi:grpE protein homolog 2, mitochondrial-like isoform X1 [Macadamia integrifolia]|uniref:grpE protein homolog 2, mitochondrial-like isoform X1 n=1 Tax=Macadamia integrifolia TaxID=60698 RepID=UPI001C52A68E|nr:grpE protein homolog 2, mitochondrial-like isoform X1 [Macadamia integrifolia]